MDTTIVRRAKTSTIYNLTTSTSTAQTFRLTNMAGAKIHLGTMHTASTTIQVFESTAESAGYGRLRDSSGVAADITLSPSTAERSVHSFPDALFGAEYFRLVVGNTATTGVPYSVTLKS